MNRKIIVVWLFISVFSITALGQRNINDAQFSRKDVHTAETHTPISINSENDLAAFPDKTGSGSSSEPYIIQDLVIDAGGSSSCIFLGNTRSYVTFQNCTLLNPSPAYGRAGIETTNASNVFITNCTFSGTGWGGVNFYNSSWNTVFNCSFTMPTYTVRTYICNYISVQDNLVTGTGHYGIDLSNTNHSIVKNNEIYHALVGGIRLSGSTNGTISQNLAQDCDQGIEVETSTVVKVSSNILSRNRQNGIYFLQTDNSIIEQNEACFCPQNGIKLTTSDSNTLTYNELRYNENDGTLVDQSMSNIITNNRMLGNFHVDIEFSQSNGNSVNNNKLCTSLNSSSTNTFTNNICEYTPNLDPYFSDYQSSKCSIVEKIATISFTYDAKDLVYALYLCVMVVDNTTTQKVLVSSAFLLSETDYYVSNAMSSISYNISFSAPGFSFQDSNARSDSAPFMSFSDVIHEFRLSYVDVATSLFPLYLSVTLEYAVSGPNFSKTGSYTTSKDMGTCTTEPGIAFATFEFILSLMVLSGLSVILLRKRTRRDSTL